MDLYKAKFRHLPLSSSDPSEIRVVKVSSAGFDQPVRCELEHVSLDSNPNYWTLSYTWGDPKVTEPITLDGEEFPVTANLFAFLRHLQSMLEIVSAFAPPRFMKYEAHVHAIMYEALLMLPNDFFSSSEESRAAVIQLTVIKPYISRIIEEERQRHPEYMAGKSDEERYSEYFEVDEVEVKRDPAALRIWIDSLCINQTDLAERNSQVVRMKAIYEKSTFLAIWLGDYGVLGEDRVVSAFNFMEHLQGAMSAAFVNGPMSSELQNKPARLRARETEIPTLDIDSDAAGRKFLEGILQESSSRSWQDSSRDFGVLLRRQWFTRVWCVQELAVSPSDPIVICGFQRIRWTDVALTRHIRSFIATTLSARIDAGSNNIARLEAIRKDIQEGISLVETLPTKDAFNDRDIAERLYALLYRTASRFAATDPHDILYALLGLVGAESVPDLRPRYDLPVMEANRQFATYLVKNTGDLSCLSVMASNTAGGPSWVPDWNELETYENRIFPNVKATYVSVSQDGLCLELEGAYVGTLVALARIKSLPPAFEAMRDHLRGRRELDAWDDEYLTTLRATVIGFELTISQLCDRLSYDFDVAAVQQNFQRLWSGAERTPYEIMLGREEANSLSPVDWKTEVIKWGSKVRFLKDRSIGILRDGRILLTKRNDQETDPGDEVWMLKGPIGPFIVRNDGEGYQLVGGCAMLDPYNPDEAFYAEQETHKIELR